jgi:hypothetical protein
VTRLSLVDMCTPVVGMCMVLNFRDKSSAAGRRTADSTIISENTLNDLILYILDY